MKKLKIERVRVGNDDQETKRGVRVRQTEERMRWKKEISFFYLFIILFKS
jgi:hypothetical protein